MEWYSWTHSVCSSRFIEPAEHTDATERFHPFRVGFDHLALAIADAGELDGLQAQLDAAGVPNHGIEQDLATGASYISFYDPHGVAWELYACHRGRRRGLEVWHPRR
jgi:hypothetical protein